MTTNPEFVPGADVVLGDEPVVVEAGETVELPADDTEAGAAAALAEYEAANYERAQADYRPIVEGE